MTTDQNILHDFVPQDDFAREHKTTPRTVGRYRAQGLPWMYWNGAVYIGPIDEARAWVLARVSRTAGSRAAKEVATT